MASRHLRTPLLTALALLAGAGMAAAALAGLLAATVVAAAVGLWAVGLNALSSRRTTVREHASFINDTDGDRAANSLPGYLDASPLPLLLLDSGTRLIALNRAARLTFRTDRAIVDPPKGLIKAIVAGGPGEAGRVDIYLDGRVRAFALATRDVSGSLGEGRIAALTDIEAELRAAEAGTLRDLVRVLGHEIANTVTPIASLSRTVADILAEDDADVTAIREAVETIARRADALQRFGEAYGELSRLPAPEVAPFDTAAFIGDLERLFRTRWPAIAFACHRETPPPVLKGDRDQLHAALWAVLQNAAEAGDPAAPQVALRCHHRTGRTEFVVADNGAGIGSDIAEEIFQPFVTHKRDGSGIGLALARQVLRAHRGDVVLQDVKGSGARIALFLPAE